LRNLHQGYDLGQEGNLQAAYNAFRRAAKLDERDIDVRTISAWCAICLESTTAQFPTMKLFWPLIQNHLSALINLGNSFQYLRRFADALAILRQTVHD